MNVGGFRFTVGGVIKTQVSGAFNSCLCRVRLHEGLNTLIHSVCRDGHASPCPLVYSSYKKHTATVKSQRLSCLESYLEAESMQVI